MPNVNLYIPEVMKEQYLAVQDDLKKKGKSVSCLLRLGIESYIRHHAGKNPHSDLARVLERVREKEEAVTVEFNF